MKDMQIQKVMLDLLNEHVRLTKGICKITIALENGKVVKTDFTSQIKLLLEQKDAMEKLCSVLQKRIANYANDL